MPLSIVVGLGRSGSGAARLLQAQGHDVVVLERGDTPALQDTAQALRQQNITIELGCPLELDSFTPWLDQASEVVISPGIAWDHPTLHALRAQGLRVRGEMSL
ncbi:MAG: NAD(P)-binding protein, partial [Prochlorococcaceae cyanobacterium]